MVVVCEVIGLFGNGGEHIIGLMGRLGLILNKWFEFSLDYNLNQSSMGH